MQIVWGVPKFFLYADDTSTLLISKSIQELGSMLTKNCLMSLTGLMQTNTKCKKVKPGIIQKH